MAALFDVWPDFNTLSEEDKEFLDEIIKDDWFKTDKEFFDKLQQAEIYDDDVLVYSYPKSGITWMQILVATLKYGVEFVRSNFNARNDYWFLELNFNKLSGQTMKSESRSRLLKSHLRYDLLPLGIRNHVGKIIYVIRDPKDSCVSYYHFCRQTSLFGYRGTFEQFFNLYMKGRVPFLDWLTHVTDMMSESDHSRVIVVKYEDMITDLKDVIRRVAQFLAFNVTDDEIENIAEFVQFSNLKEKPKLTQVPTEDESSPIHILRKGIIGDWRNHMTSEMATKMNETFLKPVRKFGINYE